MNIEMALRSALVTISQVHILAAEADRVAQAMDLISKSVNAIAAAKEGKTVENHDGQGKDV